MAGLRNCQVSVWDTDVESPSSSQRNHSNVETDRRRTSTFKRACSECPCILQVVAAILITGSFTAAILIPFEVMRIQKEHTTQSMSTTVALTTSTMVTTTSATTITTTSVTTVTTTSTVSTTSTTTTSTDSSTSATTSTVTTSTTTTVASTIVTTPACYFGDDYVDLVERGRRRIGSLNVGDRVWTLSSDRKRLLEDKIIVIGHSGPNTPTYFYTFTTIEGHIISLVGSHYIVVMAKDENEVKIICASQVTLEHELIMADRTIGLEKIVYSERIGFYSPISYSGYLLVNNISTSVYVDYLPVSHDFYHQMAAPFRVYYRVTRWLFGKDFNPFGTTVNEEIHPVSIFVIDNYQTIQFCFTILPFMVPLMSIVLVLYLTERNLFHRTTYYYLKMK